MKLCRYCLHQMRGETQTVSGNHKRFYGYYNCQKCQALCDGLYEFGKNGTVRTISEDWKQGTIISPSQYDNEKSRS